MTALKMHATTPTVKGIARPIKRLLGEAPISQVLEQMMREKLHIALVVSKEDKVLGLVTLEDIIEELVGDIEDEEDSLPSHMHPTSGGWLMGGGVPMNAVSSRLGVPWRAAFAKSPTRHSRFGDGAASAGARRSFSGGGPPYERLRMRRANELMARQFQRVRRPAHMADQNFSFHLSCCAKNMLAVAVHRPRALHDLRFTVFKPPHAPAVPLLAPAIDVALTQKRPR